jgi:hypothetical protein
MNGCSLFLVKEVLASRCQKTSRKGPSFELRSMVLVEVNLSCQNHLVVVAVRSGLPVVWAVGKSRAPLCPSEQHAGPPLVPRGYAPLSLVPVACAAQPVFAPMTAPAQLL